MTLTAPRRPTRTYRDPHTGRETYADTGRPVDERLGTHVVLWIVDDPQAWAAAVEAEGDAQLALWPKRYRGTGEIRRIDAYESAAQIRAEGPRRSFYTHCHTSQEAGAVVASLRQSHPNPGVRYEVAEITEAGACLDPDCRAPVIKADGQWRHCPGRYSAACTT